MGHRLMTDSDSQIEVRTKTRVTIGRETIKIALIKFLKENIIPQKGISQPSDSEPIYVSFSVEYEGEVMQATFEYEVETY